METDAIITACAMTYFGISSLDMPVDEVIPPHILNGSDDEKRLWYHRHVKSMVLKYVMNKESEIFHSMVEGVQQHNRPKSRDIYNCRVCNKEYRYKKAMENHETKKHDYNVHKDESSTDTSEETEKSKSLQLQANIYALCTPQEAHRLMWNRTVNVKGQKGKNISLDLRLEHLNHILKEMLRNLGPNLNEVTAARASHSLMRIEKFLKSVDEEVGRHQPSGHHVIAKWESDFKELVNQFHIKGIFINSFKFLHEGREYDKFPKFDRNVYSSSSV
ncbi:PREDICTED: uncharacterized protein LOC107352495, partial [Paramuricea clavata]